VDLQPDAACGALGVQLRGIATDSLGELDAAAAQYDTAVPLLSDADAEVSRADDVLQWAVPSGEPGHSFVLIDRDGRVAWIRDYGAPENGGVMYVAPADLVREIAPHV